MLQVIIIGGGAAGFFAAIRCAEVNPEASVTILEAGREVLQKVKVSGGGRCNVTHACFDPRELVKFYPRGNKALRGPFSRFAPGDTMDWFESREVPLKIEADGRIFPVSNRSQSIMDCLLQAAQAAGIQVLKQQRVVQLYPPEETGQRWKLMTAEGVSYFADKVMVAAGSSKPMWDILAHLGHTIVAPVPSLFTFNIQDPRLEELPGVAVPMVEIALPQFSFQDAGPLLITHWGLSGPAVLKLSAWAARELASVQYQFTIRLNFLPGDDPESVRERIGQLRQEEGKKLTAAASPFGLPMRLWKKLLAAAQVGEQQRWADLNKRQVQALAIELTEATFQVHGKSTFKEEFVTAGGIDLDEVHFKTFESKIHRGLFFGGEILDIDAVTGGFNFQAAWTGGWIAGEAMATTD